MSKRKREPEETEPKDSTVAEVSAEGGPTPSKKSKAPKKVKKLDPKKFGGMTEEEVMKLTLPDHLKPNLDIIFVCWPLLILCIGIVEY